MPAKKSKLSKKSGAPRPQRSPAHRLRSVQLVLDGDSVVKVAKRFGDARRTVAVWVERYRKHGMVGLESASHSGRPPALDPSQYEKLKSLVAEAYKESRKVSGGTLVTLIKNRFGASLTRRQCERILKRLHGPKVKYFAYGSNLLTQRLQARVSSADKLMRYALPCYTLRFHKMSSDNSAKCNIIETGSKKDIVHGVIFDISEIQIGALNVAEGLNKGYRKETWSLEIDGRKQDVFVYVAEASHIDNSLQPYDWYLDLVLAGAEQHGLPENYVANIKSVPFTVDRDLNRDGRREAIKALKAYARSKERRKR